MVKKLKKLFFAAILSLLAFLVSVTFYWPNYTNALANNITISQSAPLARYDFDSNNINSSPIHCDRNSGLFMKNLIDAEYHPKLTNNPHLFVKALGESCMTEAYKQIERIDKCKNIYSQHRSKDISLNVVDNVVFCKDFQSNIEKVNFYANNKLKLEEEKRFCKKIIDYNQEKFLLTNSVCPFSDNQELQILESNKNLLLNKEKINSNDIDANRAAAWAFYINLMDIDVEVIYNCILRRIPKKDMQKFAKILPPSQMSYLKNGYIIDLPSFGRSVQGRFVVKT